MHISTDTQVQAHLKDLGQVDADKFNILLAARQQVFDTWDDTQQQTDHVLVDGDHVVILGHFAGTGKKTGQAFSVPLAAVWRLEDGRVKEVRPFYFDTKLMHDAHYGG